MNEKVSKLMFQYSELDSEDRKKLREEIEKFEKKEYLEKRTFNESLRKSLGPTNIGNCPVCGK